MLFGADSSDETIRYVGERVIGGRSAGHETIRYLGESGRQRPSARENG